MELLFRLIEFPFNLFSQRVGSGEQGYFNEIQVMFPFNLFSQRVGRFLQILVS
ncbi:hypothetical protein MC7420_992 [Coleofasciculus chthonoplastes PCC 7420]|uniref:Uncharacterized protein n=1 Tax=Coleofasciculus chthonoplastes PCC 7420 TaxID=118168 RepID=B4W0B0_9CYAN|nr:hypothetical protein MC7420_992 [Coleofasciculus chthonoplastes PCC 7420]